MWEPVEGVVRVGIGGFLAAAGGTKLLHPLKWREAWLLSYRTLPRPLVVPVARTLPAIEIACGLALVFGARLAALAATVLLTVITLIAAGALVRGMRVSCGCLGETSALLSWRLVSRNVVLATATLIVASRGLALPRIDGLGLLAQGCIVTATAFTCVALARLSLLVRQRRMLAELTSAQA